ncbi:MAG TPA: NADH:flavin oxidoreductase, partial [Novosphingobium sp.]
RLLASPQITVVDNTHVLSVGDDGVLVETNGSDGAETRTILVDRVFLAQGRQSSNALAEELSRTGIAVSVIGDSRKVGRIGDAVHTAYQAVQALRAEYAAPTPVAC